MLLIDLAGADARSLAPAAGMRFAEFSSVIDHLRIW
jgi:hypothetical protein